MDTTKQSKDTGETLEKVNQAFDEGKIRQVFVVGIDASGAYYVWYSGNWHNLALASSVLQHEFSANSDGAVE